MKRFSPAWVVGVACLVLSAAGLAAAPVDAPARPAAVESACVTCHLDADDSKTSPAVLWSNDVHATAGLGCEDCHGGDPSPALAEDPDGSMAEKKGFQPAPDRLAVPGFCARCHADADYMKTFNPQARVDQLVEYRSSVHGKRNAAGDPVPAVCTDCHEAHGIRAVSAPDAPVYPTHVAGTCGTCHASADVMRPYGLSGDTVKDYLASAHAAALIDGEDISAPTCNDCHGNHGATPPGVHSVASLCGQCHAREARLFSASPKKQIFEELEVGECVVCHGNHEILHPTVAFFHGDSEPRVSTGQVTARRPFAADIGDLPAGNDATATWMVILRPHVEEGDPRLAHRIRVESDGADPLWIDARFDPGGWKSGTMTRVASAAGIRVTLTARALEGGPVTAGDTIQQSLRIEAVSELTSVGIRDVPGPVVQPVEGSVCLQCHSPGDVCDQATEQMYTALLSMDRALRDAGSLLHQAEIAGMEVSSAQFELKSQGQTASVESRALIHSFDPARVARQAEKGRAVAAKARSAAVAALDELRFRHQGLGVSLVLVALVLLALGLKIRQVNRLRANR
ncbi:MAG: cytochrome c3 family protein [Acidobacteriota bacterium]